MPSLPLPQSDNGRTAAPAGLLAFLCGFSFVLSLNNGVLNPLLPDLASGLDVSIPMAGQLASLSLLVAAIASLLLGIFSDFWGRRQFMVGGMAVLGVGALAAAVAPSYGLALAARALGGLGFAMSVGLALAGDWYDGTARDRAAARMLMGEALAWVAGVPLAALLGHFFGWRWALATYGAVALVGALLGRALLPSSQPTKMTGSPPRILMGILANHRSRPDLVCALLANGARNTFWIGFITYVSPFYVDSFGLETWALGPLLACGALVFIAGAEIGGRWTSRLGAHRLSGAACIAAAALGAAVPLISDFPSSLAAMLAFCLACGIVNSTLVALVLRLAPGGRGATMALNSTVTNLGAAFGVAFSGALIAAMGYRGLAVGAASIAVLASGLVALSAAITPGEVRKTEET